MQNGCKDKVSYEDGSRSEPISWKVKKYFGWGKNITDNQGKEKIAHADRMSYVQFIVPRKKTRVYVFQNI